MDTPRPLSSHVARILIAAGLIAAALTLLPFVLKVIFLTAVVSVTVFGVKRILDGVKDRPRSSRIRTPDAVYEPVRKKTYRPHAPALTILASK